MQELGLLSDTSWLCLDQWEIQRDHVVLNRKLGEGAFGTVYGGEALIDDVWVAVAVKTLKIGSNPEEKVRRHKGRVKLNAKVCYPIITQKLMILQRVNLYLKFPFSRSIHSWTF